MLFSLQSCYVQQPNSISATGKDYNERQEINNPTFVQRNNPAGVGLQIVTPIIAGAAMYQYVDPVVKYQDGAETKGFKPANAAIGVIGMLAINKLINYAFGFNKSQPINASNYNKWMSKTKLDNENAYIVNGSYNQFTIIPKKNESNYDIKNLNDVLQFKGFFENASEENINRVIAKATPVLEQNDLLELIKLYPDYKEIYPVKKKYIVTSKDYNTFWARTTQFPEVQLDRERLSSDYVVNAGNLLDFLSKYPASMYLDKVKVNSYKEKYTDTNLQNSVLKSNGLFEISEEVFKKYAQNSQEKYNNYFDALFALEKVKSLKEIVYFYTETNWLINLVSSENKLEKAWNVGNNEYANGDLLVYLLSSFDEYGWGLKKSEIQNFIDNKLTSVTKDQVKISYYQDKRSSNKDMDDWRNTKRGVGWIKTNGTIYYLVYGDVVNNSKFSLPITIETTSNLWIKTEGLGAVGAKLVRLFGGNPHNIGGDRITSELSESYSMGYLKPNKKSKFAVLHGIDGSKEVGIDVGFDIFSVQYAERVKLEDHRFNIQYNKEPVPEKLREKQKEWLEFIDMALPEVGMRDAFRNISFKDSQQDRNVEWEKIKEENRRWAEQQQQLRASKNKTGDSDYQVVYGKKVGVLRTSDQNYFSAEIWDNNQVVENYSELLFNNKGELLKENKEHSKNDEMKTFTGEHAYPLTLIIGYGLDKGTILKKDIVGRHCKIIFYKPGHYKIDIEDLENPKK